jgi:hypothetical protein
MLDKFEALEKLGAGEFNHLDGNLIEHLSGTQQLLEKWGANIELQNAGLYHAAYGTAGFDERLVCEQQRGQIADIIGKAAEEIVYQYCACERENFFAEIGQTSQPKFNNRFTGKTYCLAQAMMENFCELTAANEVEIALDNPSFLDQYGAGLHALFTKMRPYLSHAAQLEVARVFG